MDFNAPQTDFLFEDQNQIKINFDDKDMFICGFYPAVGFTTRGDRMAMARDLRKTIFTAEQPFIFKWLDSENALDWYNPDDLPPEDIIVTKDSWRIRTPQIGLNFRAKQLTNAQSTTFSRQKVGFTKKDGTSYVRGEQEVQKKFTFFVQSDIFFVDEFTVAQNTQRLFFLVPELGGQDLLFVKNLTHVIDRARKFSYSILTLASLSDSIRNLSGGKIIDNSIRFSAPGENPILPVVRHEQEGNETMFFDEREDSISGYVTTKKKRLWLNDILVKKNKGVKYLEVQNNGLAGFGNVVVWARKKDPNNPLLVGRSKMLFLSDIGVPPPGAYDSAYERSVTAVTGELTIANFFKGSDSQLAELGLWYDVEKSRSDSGTLKILLKTGSQSVVNGTNFTIGDPTPKITRINGFTNLRLLPYSDFTLNANASTVGSDVVDEWESDFEDINLTLTDVINTNLFTSWHTEKLDFEGVKLSNTKGFWKSATASFLGVSGAVAGGAFTKSTIGAAGAGYLSTTIAKPITNIFFKYIPDSWFTNANYYRPKSNETFLIPTNFLEKVLAKIPPQEFPDATPEKTVQKYLMVPLCLFDTPQKNFLGGIANSKIFPTSYYGRLTDQFRGQNRAKTFNTLDFLGGLPIPDGMDGITYEDFSGENAINIGKKGILTLAPADSEDEYIIDFIQIKSLGNSPVKFKFYSNSPEFGINENAENSDELTWSITVNTQSNYTGDLRDWRTILVLSDFADNEKNADQRWAPKGYSDRIPETITRLPGQDSVNANISELFLQHKNNIILKNDLNVPQFKFVRSGQSINNDLHEQKSGFTIVDTSFKKAGEINEGDFEEIFKHLENVYWDPGSSKPPSLINTFEKKINILKDVYLFKKLKISPVLHTAFRRSNDSFYSIQEKVINEVVIDLPEDQNFLINDCKFFDPYGTRTSERAKQYRTETFFDFARLQNDIRYFGARWIYNDDDSSSFRSNIFEDKINLEYKFDFRINFLTTKYLSAHLLLSAQEQGFEPGDLLFETRWSFRFTVVLTK